MASAQVASSVPFRGVRRGRAAALPGYGKLRRCTEKHGSAVDLSFCLAAAFVTLRVLVRRSTTRYRWDGRPTVECRSERNT